MVYVLFWGQNDKMGHFGQNDSFLAHFGPNLVILAGGLVLVKNGHFWPDLGFGRDLVIV